jgi:hypothetical protein
VLNACVAMLLASSLTAVPESPAAEVDPTWLSDSLAAVAVTVTTTIDPLDAPPPQPARSLVTRTRPGMLPSLYVSYAALQAFDGYSTLHALRQGATEANPIMRGLVGKPVLFLVVKGATTYGLIKASEYLWRKGHPRTAAVLMFAANGAMALVAANNASVLRSQR